MTQYVHTLPELKAEQHLQSDMMTYRLYLLLFVIPRILEAKNSYMAPRK